MSRQEILSLKTYEPHLTSGRDYTSVCRRGGHRTTNTSRVSGAENESGNKKKKHSGCVYILSNPSIPNLLKIGYTSKTARERAKEIDSTGVPTPFHVEYEAFVSNPKKTERKVHEILRSKRPNDNREFFECQLDEAITAIERVAGPRPIDDRQKGGLKNKLHNPNKPTCTTKAALKFEDSESIRRSLAEVKTNQANAESDKLESLKFAYECAKKLGYNTSPIEKDLSFNHPCTRGKDNKSFQRERQKVQFASPTKIHSINWQSFFDYCLGVLFTAFWVGVFGWNVWVIISKIFGLIL